jgi:hypothetical protein
LIAWVAYDSKIFWPKSKAKWVCVFIKK